MIIFRFSVFGSLTLDDILCIVSLLSAISRKESGGGVQITHTQCNSTQEHFNSQQAKLKIASTGLRFRGLLNAHFKPVRKSFLPVVQLYLDASEFSWRVFVPLSLQIVDQR